MTLSSFSHVCNYNMQTWNTAHTWTKLNETEVKLQLQQSPLPEAQSLRQRSCILQVQHDGLTNGWPKTIRISNTLSARQASQPAFQRRVHPCETCLFLWLFLPCPYPGIPRYHKRSQSVDPCLGSPVIVKSRQHGTCMNMLHMFIPLSIGQKMAYGIGFVEPLCEVDMHKKHPPQMPKRQSDSSPPWLEASLQPVWIHQMRLGHYIS